MSGPKGVRVSVVSAVELRRREDEARSARCEHLALALAGLAAQLRMSGRSLPVDIDPPAVRGHDALIGWEQSLQGAVSDAQARVRVEAARDVARRFAAAERAESTRGLDTSGVRLGGSPPLDPQALVTVIAELRDNTRRGELAHEAAGLFKGGGAGTSQVVAFRNRVEAEVGVQRLRDLAAQSVLDVAHIVTPRANQIRSSAAFVSTAEELSAIEAEVAELQAAAAKASDAAFIEDALHDVLSELGFTIGEGFDLEDLGRSVAIGDHPDHPGYGLRVQINPDNAMLYTRLVADGDSTPEADARAEEDSCAKVVAIAEKLEGHGVAAAIDFERQPGDAPVERRSAASVDSRRRRPRRGSVGRTRSA